MCNLCFVSTSASSFASDIHAINDRHGNIFFGTITYNFSKLWRSYFTFYVHGLYRYSFWFVLFPRLFIAPLYSQSEIKHTEYYLAREWQRGKSGKGTHMCTRVAFESSYGCDKKLLEQALMIHFLWLWFNCFFGQIRDPCFKSGTLRRHAISVAIRSSIYRPNVGNSKNALNTSPFVRLVCFV